MGELGMWRDRLATFTDRREALALFDHLRSRDPAKEWPLLPILAFIAPGGSGKSTLIEYLRAKKCSFGSRAAIPYAVLDFTLTDAPRDLLSILINLRDQLQRHDDGSGKHLLFPRFDLGTLVAQSAVTNPHASVSGPGEVRQRLSDGKQFIEALNTLGSELGRAIPFVPALLAGLNLAGQIKLVRDLLNYLEDNTGWQWYHMHGSSMGLTASASLKDVLLRLQALSVPGRQEREWLVNEVLPAAFMADLAGCLLASDPPRCWTKVTNVLVLLAGFEALQRSSANTASQLLHVLATEPRRDGSTDPLLLVVGGRDYLPGMPAETLEDPLAQTTAQDEREAKSRIKQLHARWQQQLPAQKRHLRSHDLYLTLALHDFGWQDSRSYLLKLDEREQVPVFAADDALVETIERATHGHPLYLALAAEAALEARARGRALLPGDFELAEVSPDIAPGHQDERVKDYLLDLFLRQISESERKELIYCAVPRYLDPALLRVLLPALDDMDRQKRWDYYRRLTFVSATGDERVVFHPIVRALLGQLLPVGEPESDYRRLHSRLREHFQNLTINQGQSAPFDWQAQV